MYLLLIIQLILQLTNNVYSLSTNFMSYSSIHTSINKQYSQSNYDKRTSMNINSISQRQNSVSYSYKSYSYKSYSYKSYSYKSYSYINPTMKPITSQPTVEIPKLNFETDLRMDGVKTDNFNELEKNAIIKTTAHTLNVSEENLYWKNAYFEKSEVQTNLRLQSNVKLRIVIQVNITLTGVYSPYIKNPTMLFTLLSTNLDLGVTSNTFNTYLQTITMILNLLKFANANLITAANNNMQILGVDLTFNMTTFMPTLHLKNHSITLSPSMQPNSTTVMPTFTPSLSSQNPSPLPTNLRPSMQPNLSTNIPTFIPSLSLQSPSSIPTNLRPSMQSNLTSNIPTFTPSLLTQLPTTLAPNMQTNSTTLLPIFVTTHGPTYMTSMIPTNYPTNLSNCPSSITSNIPSSIIEVLDNNDDESKLGKILIYAVYMPIGISVAIYIICILSKKVKTKFNKLHLEPIVPNQEEKHNHNIIKNNKIADDTNV